MANNRLLWMNPDNRGIRYHRPAVPLALLIIATVLGGCLTGPAASEHEPVNVISVTGTGRVSVKPDTVLVNVGIEARAPALADATADVSRRMTDVLASVKALGIMEQDITTVGYSVEPIVAQRRSDTDASHILAYHAVNVVQLRIRDTAAIGRIVDRAVASGANTIAGLQFTVKDPGRAQGEARGLAVREAAAKAQEIAAAAGVQLGAVVSINEGGSPLPIIARAAVMATAPSGPGPVEAGQLEIVVSVQARYRILPR